ncbi:hypothetical protein OsI_23648 [Oryza sativa Indica Group]|uniref:Uncharacterized protein n=1 Tax=Oryza sativa subsp. indica TaxID=39946 RepID=B8B4E8_ORYSI|nr:hypothetical protein OsI_23648 [Oryza sativa Indica Group]
MDGVESGTPATQGASSSARAALGTVDGGRRWCREGRRRRGGPTAQGASPWREDGADAATLGEVGGAGSEAASPRRSRAGKGGGGPAAAAQRGLRTALPACRWRSGAGEGMDAAAGNSSCQSPPAPVEERRNRGRGGIGSARARLSSGVRT